MYANITFCTSLSLQTNNQTLETEQLQRLRLFPLSAMQCCPLDRLSDLKKKSQGIYQCFHSCITATERLITPFIHHYHSTFKIQLNDNNYKYKTCLHLKFFSSHKSQFSTIVFLPTEKHELMATFPDEHNFLLPQTFFVMRHFIISSCCMLHGN